MGGAAIGEVDTRSAGLEVGWSEPPQAIAVEATRPAKRPARAVRRRRLRQSSMPTRVRLQATNLRAQDQGGVGPGRPASARAHADSQVAAVHPATEDSPVVRFECGAVCPTVRTCAKLRSRGRPSPPWINGVSSFRCSPRISQNSYSRPHRASPRPLPPGACRSRGCCRGMATRSINGVSNSRLPTTSWLHSARTAGVDVLRLEPRPCWTVACMPSPGSAPTPPSWRFWSPGVPLPSPRLPQPAPCRLAMGRFPSLSPTRLR